MKLIILILSGLSGGLAVGGSIVAFYTVLGIVTRIIDLSGHKQLLWFYKLTITLGVFASSIVYFFNISISIPRVFLILTGFIFGIFVGMIAAALTETFDIISQVSETLNITKWIYVLVMIIILGKMLGSALTWLLPAVK